MKLERGRPCYAPTDSVRRYVFASAGLGISHDDIAKKLHISRDTLEKHFACELRVGKSIWRDGRRCDGYTATQPRAFDCASCGSPGTGEWNKKFCDKCSIGARRRARYQNDGEFRKKIIERSRLALNRPRDIERQKRRRMMLSDAYVADIIGARAEFIPDSLLEAKRLHLKVLRLLKDLTR